MEDLLIVNATVAGIIGTFAPFVLPFLFNFIEKKIKRTLEKNEKRIIVTTFAVAISVGIILVNFNWETSSFRSLLQFFFVNFVAVKGMVQTIYELLIKEIPALNERFS